MAHIFMETGKSHDLQTRRWWHNCSLSTKASEPGELAVRIPGPGWEMGGRLLHRCLSSLVGFLCCSSSLFPCFSSSWLFYISIIERRGIEIPYCYYYWAMPSFNSVSFCFRYLGSLIFVAYILVIVIFS